MLWVKKYTTQCFPVQFYNLLLPLFDLDQNITALKVHSSALKQNINTNNCYMKNFVSNSLFFKLFVHFIISQFIFSSSFWHLMIIYTSIQLKLWFLDLNTQIFTLFFQEIISYLLKIFALNVGLKLRLYDVLCFSLL